MCFSLKPVKNVQLRQCNYLKSYYCNSTVSSVNQLSIDRNLMVYLSQSFSIQFISGLVQVPRLTQGHHGYCIRRLRIIHDFHSQFFIALLFVSGAWVGSPEQFLYGGDKLLL